MPGDVVVLAEVAAAREQRIHLRLIALAARVLRELSPAGRARLLADAAALVPEEDDA